MPSEKLTSRVSPQWKELGFQGNDPATDFRGMGLFGLMCLQYPSNQLSNHLLWLNIYIITVILPVVMVT